MDNVEIVTNKDNEATSKNKVIKGVTLKAKSSKES